MHYGDPSGYDLRLRVYSPNYTLSPPSMMNIKLCELLLGECVLSRELLLDGVEIRARSTMKTQLPNFPTIKFEPIKFKVFHII